MDRYFVCFLMLLLSTEIYAQQNLDSLYGVWQDAGETDSTKVNAYEQYIRKGFLFTKPDSALVLIEALHRYAKVQKYPKAESLGYNLEGIVNLLHGNYIKALDYYQKSIALSEEIQDRHGIAAGLNGIGALYLNQGNYNSALESFQKSLAIREEIQDNQGIAASLNNIAHIYADQGNHKRALEYCENSLAIREEIGDREEIGASLNNIGAIYYRDDNYPLALEYYKKSLIINQEIGNLRGVAFGFNNLAGVYQEQNKYPLALEYYEKALAIHQEIGFKESIALTLKNIGNIHGLQGNYARSSEYCKRSLVLAQQIGQLWAQREACQCLYLNYKDLSNGNEALVYLEKMRVLEDSLNDKETIKKLEQMEFAKQIMEDSLLQVEKDLQVEMAHQAEVRKKDRNRNLAIGAGVFFLVLSGGLYSRWRYIRKSKRIIEKEKDRSENLLLNILPSEIAEELKLKGSVEAQDFDQVSVLFTDFKGFTTRSEKLSARDLVNEINHCFKAFDHICEKYRIEKIKTIGDAFMAGGGLPVPSDDAVKNTVLAALEMQAFMAQRIEEKKVNNEVPFEMRVGINTGPVVAGIVGVKKFQYDIWGDTVNTAARMESSGEVGKVNISEATYQVIKDDPQFSFVSRGKIQTKGKGKVEMYFVSLQEAA